MSVGPLLGAADAAAVVIATQLGAPATGWGAIVLAAEAAFLVTLVAGRQRSRLLLRLRPELPVLVIAAVAAALVLALASDTLALRRTDDWVQAGVIALLAFLLLALGRGVVYGCARLLRRTRRVMSPAVLVGTGEMGHRVAETFAARPDTGVAPLGFVGGGDPRVRGLPLPYLGDLDSLPRVLVENEQVDVIFCLDARPDAETEDAMRCCLSAGRRVFMTHGPWLRGAERGPSEVVGEIRLTLVRGLPRSRRRQTEGALSQGSAPASRADQPQVDAGQLAS